MTKLIYASCDGKMSDIKQLEQSSYWDFCAFLDNYLTRVDEHNKAMEKMNQKFNSGKPKRNVKSGGK